MHPAMRDLVDELKRVAAEEGDPARLIARIKPLALPLARDLGWLPRDAYDCDPDQGFGVTIFHAEPDDTLVVETVAWLPGRGVAPHNHKTWGVVVGLDGAERNIGWRRLDDGSAPGRAELVADREIVVRRGDCIGLMPEDIHSIRNETAETSISLHIYGRNLATVARQQFDPAAGTVMPCPQRVRRAVGGA